MFELINKLLICKSENDMIFKPKRLAFEKGPSEGKEKEPGAAGVDEKDKTPEEIDKILNGGKEKGVKFDKDPEKNLSAIAEKVYKSEKKQKLFVEDMKLAIQESIKSGGTENIDEFWKYLAEQKCTNVSIDKDGNMVFTTIDGAKVYQTLKGVKLDAGPQKPKDKPAPAKTDEKKAEPGPKPDSSKEKDSVVPENSAEESAAKQLFAKIFPDPTKEKKGNVSIISDKYGAGSTARIPNVRDLPIYNDEGKKSSISSDDLGEFRKPATAKILKPFVVDVLTPYGKQKYVYIDTGVIEGSVRNGQFKGWVEESRLRDINKVAPEEKVKVTVDEKKVAEEKEKTDKAQKAKEARKAYLDDNGVVHLKDEKETKDIKLQTIFPNAVKGDQVTVTSKITGLTTTATFDGSDWLDTNKKHVPIYNGDKVVLLSKVDKESEKPTQPALALGETFLEKDPRKLTDDQMAQAKEGKLKWNDIAKELMDKYPTIADTGVKRPEYAKLLKKYSTETGYYWVILPEKVKASAEEEAAKEIEAGQKAAKERTKKGKKELEKKADETFTKYETIIKENQYIFVKGGVDSKTLDEIVNDKSKWKEAWDKNYPLNSKLIIDAFKRPPYNGISETAIRDGVREVIYSSVGTNKFKFSTLFDVFNKNGAFFTKYEGGAGSHSDFMNELKRYNRITDKMNANRAAEVGNYWKGISVEDQEFWRFTDSDKYQQVMVGAALIFDSIVYAIRPASEKPEYKQSVETLSESKMTKEDEAMIARYRYAIIDGEKVKTKEQMDEYIGDEKKWNDMWDKETGNIAILKKALSRAPFNKISLSAHKSQIREAMHYSVADNGLTMNNLLMYLNKNGEMYKNRDGIPGSWLNFKDEVYLEQIGRRKKEGKPLSPEQEKAYQECEYRDQLGGARYDELVQLWVSTAYVLDAISLLDPTAKYVERAPEAEQPKVFLDGIFSPTDTGSINGKSQDYYDTYSDSGTRIAGGGIFTGGLFKYDFRDRAKGISDFDKVSSFATANAIIADQCRDLDGKVNKTKLQNRLNELLMLGLASLLSEPESDQKTAALEALGISKEDVKKPDIVPTAAKKHEIKFGKDATLTSAQKDLVRLGFMLESAAKPGQVKEVSETPIEWSTNPKIRHLQKAAIKLGAKPQDLPQIEKEMKNQLAAFLHMSANKDGIKEVGISIPIPIAGDEKKSLYLVVSPSYNFADKAFQLRAGIGGSVEIAKNVSLLGGIGAGVNSDGNWSLYAGAGVRFSIPVDKDDTWDPSLTIGALASLDPEKLEGSVLIGASLMFERNLGKQMVKDLQEKLEKAGFAAVEKATSVQEKAALLRKIPGPNGLVIAQIDATLGLTDEQLVSLYEQHIRKKIEIANAEAGLSEHKFLGFLPPITAAGVGVGLKIGKEGISVMPGVAFAIAVASELIIFQRPNISSQSLGAGMEEDMGDQAKAAILAKQKMIAEAKKAGYSKISFESAPLAGDLETGLKPIKTESASVKSEAVDKPDEVAMDKHFAEFSKELLKKGIKLEKDEKEKMYRMEILNVGNLQLYVDPQMATNMGIIFKEGKVYISASKNPTLIIKRTDMYFPRPKEGNVKHTIVTISDQDFRTQKAIMEESDYYIDSRTKDNTGAERTALTYLSVDPSKTAKQANFRDYATDKKQSKDKYNFDTLDTVTEDMTKYREWAENYKRQAEMGRKTAEKIGTFEFQGVDVPKIHAKAEEFMKKHALLYRQYTTYQLKSKPDLKKLDDQIRKDYPDLNDNEVTMLKEELFNLSMSESEKQLKGLPPEKRKEKLKSLVLEKLDWMKTTIYIPMFQEYLNKENNPQGFTAEQCAEAFVGPLRAMALENPESIPLGARLDVAVGTLGVVGRRGVMVGNPDSIKDHRFYLAKDYSQALLTGQPPMDRTIALVLREKQRPLEKVKDDTEFLKTPWAIKLMLLGVDKGVPLMLRVLGEDAYKKLSECYDSKPPKLVEGAQDAVKELKATAMLLNDMQMGKGGTPILVDGKEFRTITINGMILGIRTNAMKSGVYERCLNASDMYDDVLMGIDAGEKYTLVGNMRSYNAAAVQSLVSSEGIRTTNIGLGAVFELGPTPPPPPPKDNGGGGTQSAGGGGNVSQAEEETDLPKETPAGGAGE